MKGLLSHDKGNTWNVIWNELIKLKNYGYNIDWKILNTKDYGIPQNRGERIFILGNKEKEIIWSEKKEMDKQIGNSISVNVVKCLLEKIYT